MYWRLRVVGLVAAFLFVGVSQAQATPLHQTEQAAPVVDRETGEFYLPEGDNGKKVRQKFPDRETDGNGGSSPGRTDDGRICSSELYTDNDLVDSVYGFDDDGGKYGKDAEIPAYRIAQRLDATLGEQQKKVGNAGPSGPGPGSSDAVVLSTSRLYSPTGEWRILECEEEQADGTTTLEFFDLVSVGGPSVTLGELFNGAMQELDPPIHGFTVNPPGKQLVQFRTLFWVDPVYWDTTRTTTRSNGNVFVTITLVPVESEWDPGNGDDPVVCDGPGEVWEPGDKGETFYCKYTYRSVEGEPFTMTSTVRFRIDTETNSTETLGPFPLLERVDTAEVGAREIQVVARNT